jgi:hypothetical protein
MSVAPSATHFRRLLDKFGIEYREVVLETAHGMPPSLTVVFAGEAAARDFHERVHARATGSPTEVAGRGWVVIIRGVQA